MKPLLRWLARTPEPVLAVEQAALRSDRFRLEREGDGKRLEAIVSLMEKGRLSRLSDEDIYGEYELQTLERVLRDERTENMVAVAEAICRKIGWEPGRPGVRGDERAFLGAYYAQLRGRLEKGMRFGKRKADKHAGES